MKISKSRLLYLAKLRRQALVLQARETMVVIKEERRMRKKRRARVIRREGEADAREISFVGRVTFRLRYDGQIEGEIVEGGSDRVIMDWIVVPGNWNRGVFMNVDLKTTGKVGRAFSMDLIQEEMDGSAI